MSLLTAIPQPTVELSRPPFGRRTCNHGSEVKALTDVIALLALSTRFSHLPYFRQPCLEGRHGPRCTKTVQGRFFAFAKVSTSICRGTPFYAPSRATEINCVSDLDDRSTNLAAGWVITK